MKWTIALVASTLYLIVVSAIHAEPRSDPPKGALIANRIVSTWSCQDKLGSSRTPVYYSPWSMRNHSRVFAISQMNKWTLRLLRCQRKLNLEKVRWNPQAWLPSNWAAVARCETSTNWYFTGHSTDGSFVSAFAISVEVYDADAHYMGVRGWWDEKTVPSPWEQMQAAIGHLKLHGDGWTGRCHGLVYG